MPRILCLAIAVLLAAVPPARAQGADPFLGTWRLNLEKSQFPGPPPAQPHVLTFEAASDGTRSCRGCLCLAAALSRRRERGQGQWRFDRDPVFGRAGSRS